MKKITNKQKEVLKGLLLTKQGTVRVSAITTLSNKEKYRVNFQTGSGRNTRVREDDYIRCLINVCDILGIKYQLNNDAPRNGKMGDYITLPIRKDIDLLELIDYVKSEPIKEVCENIISYKPFGYYSISELLANANVTMTQDEKQEFANYLKSITSYKKIQLDGDSYPYNVYLMNTKLLINIKSKLK